MRSYLFILISSFSGTLLANSLSYQGSFNRFSPTERASSHGVGVNLSSGLEHIQSIDQDDVITTYTATRAWMTKGIFWPLDAGIGIASINEEKSYSGYLQYTLYESFMTPALAFRGTHSRMFNSESAPLQTTTLQSVVSWGYRTVSLWGSLGYAFHLRNSEALVEQWGESIHDAGIYWHVLPPFFAVAAEIKTAQLSPKSYSMKISIGI